MVFSREVKLTQDIGEKKAEVDFIGTSIAFSQGLDYAQQGIMNHHLRVSLLSLYLGQALRLGEEEMFQLFRSAIIHDLGAVTMSEKAALQDFEIENADYHCVKGYDFLQDLPLFQTTAEIVRTHHDRWAGNNSSGLAKDRIPLASRIINLVDRVDVLLNPAENVLMQKEHVLAAIRKYRGVIFDPDLVEILEQITRTESIWLDLVSPWKAERIMTFLPNHHRTLDAGELHDLAELYARVVDAKSPFTYMHSRGVAQIAVFLAQKAGMSPKEVFLMNIAGLLHDLGKLTVPEEILVKPAALTRDEMAIMKQHTYYSYWWLKPAFGATPIAEWGAFHHERLDGAGYPFHKAEKELGLGCRIVAVSDIFTALREERPYRAGLSWEAIERIMLQQVKGSALDGGITALLFDNKGLIDDKWQELMEKLHA